MSESIRIEELRKEIEKHCGNCDRPDKEELGKIILSSMTLGFNEGLKVSSADRPQGRNLLEEYPSLFECSVCGASCYDTYPWDCDIKFCPNCGADMRKESE